jgi:hypothetical protein
MGTEQHILDSQWIIADIRENFQKFLESNEHENTIYKHLLDTSKAILRKLIAMSTYIKKPKRSQINSLIMYLKLLKNKNKRTLKFTDRKK